MKSSQRLNIRLLDQAITDRTSLNDLQKILDRVEKCCVALERNFNLADVLMDPSNLKSLSQLLTPDNLESGLQLIIRLALSQYRTRSFTIAVEIDRPKQLDFLYRSIGGWKDFDTNILILAKDLNPTLTLINPRRKEHWTQASRIPAGSLITGFVKTVGNRQSSVQEHLALERIQTAFEVVQNQPEVVEAKPAPTAAPIRKTTTPRKATPVKAPATLSMSLEVVVNKMDTFVHAGNAQMIIGHLANYPGRVDLFVLRGSKNPVHLDADSIWSAEIRNGERVVYDFFGPKPTEDFLKELAKRTNKYTQMDKMA